MPLERYEFSLEEIGKLLLKHQGISEGHWELGINANVDTAFTAKSSDDRMLPTVMLRLAGLILTRVEKKTPASISLEKQSPAAKLSPGR